MLPRPITTSGDRRFIPSAVSFSSDRVWVSTARGWTAEIDPRTARVIRMAYTSSQAPSATTAAGLTWVADELAGIGTFSATGTKVARHQIMWAGQPLDVNTVAYGAGLIWALGSATNYTVSLVHPPTTSVLTDTLDGDDGVIGGGDVGGERPNDQRGCRSGTASARAAGPGRWVGASRVGNRFALAVDRSPRCWRGVREACWGVRALPGERCDPLARGCGGSGAGRWCGGPELGGAAGGEGSLPLGTAGGGERVEGLLDAVGGLVALAEVADLGAGEPVG